MNYNNKINGCLKRIEIYYKQTIKNKFTNDLQLEKMHYNTLYKQIDRECDIIIQICNYLLMLNESGYLNEIVVGTRDSGDME